MGRITWLARSLRPKHPTRVSNSFLTECGSWFSKQARQPVGDTQQCGRNSSLLRVLQPIKGAPLLFLGSLHVPAAREGGQSQIWRIYYTPKHPAGLSCSVLKKCSSWLSKQACLPVKETQHSGPSSSPLRARQRINVPPLLSLSGLHFSAAREAGQSQIWHISPAPMHPAPLSNSLLAICGRWLSKQAGP